MKFDRQLIENLARELKKPLPGEDAQYRMAPAYRPRLTKEQIMSHEPRKGGVLLLLYEKNGLLYIVFTQRANYNGVHGGQMSFPGGKKEEEDEDMIQTALRETQEETGVTKEQVKVLGQLSELYIPPSNFLVSPVVGFAFNPGPFNPQKEEVEKIVEIPVEFFIDPASINLQTEIKLFNGTAVRVPAYIYHEHIIWGATAIMLSEFTFVLERAIKNVII